MKEYYLRNPNAMMRARLSSRIQKMLKGAGLKKYAKTEAIVGISVAGLIAHIQRLFKPGMTWQNRNLWHIDHRRPCSSFDLTDPIQQAQCFNFENLQPLWKEENQAKSDKYTPAAA